MNNDVAKKFFQFNKKNFFLNFFKYLFNNKPKNKIKFLYLIKKAKKKSLIDNESYNMIKGVIKIKKKIIKDVMVPKPKMVTLKINYNLESCLNIIINSSHSRFPVMSKDSNYVEGFLIAKDLLPFIQNKKKKIFSIKNIIRPTLFVPESKYLNYMLKDFRVKRNHMAIVIDEFGIISGLITIEDILEIIVGTIEDEYDYNIKNKNIKKINNNTFLIKPLTTIKEFNKNFNTKFNNKKIETIGGLIMKKFKRLPIKGEFVFINNYKFKIISSNNRKIITILLKITK
ncbi:transporter associated domain-containing protein [Buchnera aphidicola]|uniref:transporter associated domain-containing protein n=1 Tax=Buchnera aphidicola TaxID=9 RepID=UPI0031B80252